MMRDRDVGHSGEKKNKQTNVVTRAGARFRLVRNPRARATSADPAYPGGGVYKEDVNKEPPPHS